jgi:predicted dehydrogenase
MKQQENRILIVGSGQIALHHYKNLKSILGEKLNLTVVSRSQQSLEPFKKYASDKVTLLSLDQFDVDKNLATTVIIASPPETHIDWLEKLASRCHTILLEKPAVCGLEQIKLLDQLLINNPQLRLMVAENYDFKPSLNFLLQLISSQKFGKLLEIHLKKESLQKATQWKSKCGALFEGGIHFVALANSLASDEPELNSIQVHDWRINSASVERGSVITWRCKNNIKVKLRYAWDRPALFFGVGQFSQLIFENKVVHFESNGLWIQGHGVKLNDISGSRSMMKSFLELSTDPTIHDFNSSWEKSKKDLELVFSVYSKMKQSTVISS